MPLYDQRYTSGSGKTEACHLWLVEGMTVERTLGKDVPAAANALGEDFYKVILQEEPFKSTKVRMETS